MTTGRSIPPSIASVRALHLVSIVMALLARQRDGSGQRLEVPLFDSTFPPARAPCGSTIQPTSSLRPWHLERCVRVCRRSLGAVWRLWQPELPSFVEAAGITAWDQEGLTDIDRLMSDPQLRVLHTCVGRVNCSRRARPRTGKTSLPGLRECAVCTSAEWFEHPHARASQMVLEVHDPKYGTMLQPGINVRLSTPRRGAPAAPQPDPAPGGDPRGA